MKKILMFAAILGFAATGFSQCTIQGISPEERQYRANPPRGYYSTQYVPQQYGTQDGYAPYGYRGPGDGSTRGQAGARNYQGQPLKQTPYQYGGQQGQQGQTGANDQQIYKDLSEQLKDYRLGITVKDGVVTLQGNVNSASDKKKVEDIVYSYAGVKRVNNMVKVSGDQNQQNQGNQYQQGQGYQNNPSRNR